MAARDPMREPKGRPHPSGRPLRTSEMKYESYTRPPRQEFLSPGLRRGPLVPAIGFMVGQPMDEDDDAGA